MPRKKRNGKIGDLWQANHINGKFVNFLLISHSNEVHITTLSLNWKVAIINTNEPSLFGYSFVFDKHLGGYKDYVNTTYKLLARKTAVKKKSTEHNDNA